jgi:hypothetical protein
MKDTIITALNGLGGAVVGSTGVLLTGVLSNRAQIRRLEEENARLDRIKRADMKRAFLEELYAEADHFHKAIGTMFIHSFLFMNDQIDVVSFNNSMIDVNKPVLILAEWSSSSRLTSLNWCLPGTS